MQGDMRDQIASALKGQRADYIEVRIEERETSRIQYRGRELEDIGRSTSLGGNARALVRGGWGFVSFNDLSGLRDKVALAVKQARLVGKEESKLDPVAPVVDTVAPQIKKDPRAVTLAWKKGLLDEYNEIIWATPKIQTSMIAYGDSKRLVIFANSEGSYIEQTKVDLSTRIVVIAREDGDVQQVVLSTGSSGYFGFMEGLHQEVRETAQRAIALLSAPQVKGGE
ncbi:unnamed protein product, partial [marine sediment metagenome]